MSLGSGRNLPPAPGFGKPFGRQIESHSLLCLRALVLRPYPGTYEGLTKALSFSGEFALSGQCPLTFPFCPQFPSPSSFVNQPSTTALLRCLTFVVALGEVPQVSSLAEGEGQKAHLPSRGTC